MERVNGYLVIDGCRCEVVNEEKGHYFVYIDGEEYFYKLITYHYKELVAYYGAKMMGIDCSFYDLAVLDKEIGYISKSFRKDNVRFILGEDILNDYLKGERIFKEGLVRNIDVINNMGVKALGIDNLNDYIEDCYLESDDLNNLEIIWQALEYRYGDKINISKVMEQIILMYIFTIIFYDTDKQSSNWGILESDDDINLVPLFDNEFILNNSYAGVSLSVNFNDYNFDVTDSLINFLKISSKEFYDLFVLKFEMVEGNIERIFELVEMQIGVKIPDYDKDNMRMMFNDNCSYIRYILDGFKTRSSR